MTVYMLQTLQSVQFKYGQLRQQRAIQTKMPVTQNDPMRTHMTQAFLTHIPSLHPHFQVYMLFASKTS